MGDLSISKILAASVDRIVLMKTAQLCGLSRVTGTLILERHVNDELLKCDRSQCFKPPQQKS